ncbi:MAG TPA: NADH-quinone oxidoreductase subunit L [Actinomycetota bacterium]|nr:NADH-quinone oxidoreductase subunit L [Actinomycetota bacterium]
MVAILAAVQEGAEGVVATSGNWATEHAWLIPVLPFVAFFLILAVGKRMPRKGSEIGILTVAASFFLSLIILIGDYVGGGGPVVEHAIEWFPFAGTFDLDLGMKIDGLVAVMFVVVTLVSLMVQIYSTAYMHGDKRYTWYFAALNLFTFSMLNLVIADNLIQLLIGWEGVGICSYLLIGHWWEEHENSSAAIKAFITTRTGDVAFLVGIFVLFAAADTFNITEIIHKVEEGEISHATLTAAALLLFGGAIGKSAQFPLHVWLPDAMAGPTPVSALIHAATMVTAGVFLLARLFPVFEASTQALNFVALIGAFTMLMAALLALIQDDIKRVLAYSTISQLAYMMAALGVGAGNAAIFHLFTHAFFKALLFLGAGSLIHAVHSNNMSEMGGLKRVMPTTYKTFMIGSLALAGIPPLAGFWSKDEILTEAYRFGTGAVDPHGTQVVALIVYIAGILTAFLTAFYMSRAVHLTFEGTYRGKGHPHESPPAMTGPLVILAVLSVVAGFAGIPGWQSGFGAWVGVGGETHVPSADFVLILVSVAVAVGGIALGRRMYMPAPAREPLERMGFFYRLLQRKYYLDDLYWVAIVRPIRDLFSRAMNWVNQNVIDGLVNGTAAGARVSAQGIYKYVDQKVIDGAVNGAGISTRKTGGLLKYLQGGDVQRYAAYLFAGVAIFAFLFTRFG